MKNNLKRIRQSVGLTQEQLAEAMGTSKSYISQLESGARDIMNIRNDTMMRLCNILGCSVEELTTIIEFEINDKNKLIVDTLFTDPRYSGYIIEVNKNFFLINSFINCNDGKDVVKLLKPLPRYNRPESAYDCAEYSYLFGHLIPRTGFNVKIGRAITIEEFEELKKQYSLTEDKISGEFIDVRGNIFGEPYKKTFTSIQIQVGDDKAIPLEAELHNKGIEASNINVGRINIRIK